MPDRRTPPPTHSFGILKLPPEKTRELPGGAVLHTLTDGDQPICTLRVLFDGGAAELPSRATQGLYCNTVTEGCASLSALQIAGQLDFYGARHVPLAYEHHTGFCVSTLSHCLAPVLALLGQVYGQPLFGDREVTAAKTAATGRLKYQRQQMGNLAAEALAPLICGSGHPAAHRLTVREIESITPQALHQFHRQLYTAGGCHAYLSGNISTEALEATENYIASIPAGAPPIKVQIHPYIPQEPQRVDVVRSHAGQSAIAAAIPQIPRSHPDYHRLRLAVMALGGYFGSRLMSNIREDKGLTYGISAMLCAIHDGSYSSIAAQCSNDKVDTVLSEIANEMRRLATEPPSGAELERLQRHAYTETLEILDNADSIMSHYVTRRNVGLPHDYFARQQQAIAELEPETIAHMAAKYLQPELMRIAVAGNTGRRGTPDLDSSQHTVIQMTE